MLSSRTAFDAVFREHHATVLRFIERRIDDREQARELTMDCFEIAWRRFDPAQPPGRGWLLQTARNLVGDAYRRRDRERVGISDLAHQAQLAGDPDDLARDRVEVGAALDRLRAADREILVLTYWDGLAAAEIAEVLGCGVPAVWKRLSRAREALRALLDSDAESASNRVARVSGGERGSGVMHLVLE